MVIHFRRPRSGPTLQPKTRKVVGSAFPLFRNGIGTVAQQWNSASDSPGGVAFSSRSRMAEAVDRVYIMSFQKCEESKAVVEVEFRTTDTSYPLTDLSARTECRIVLQQFMPRRGTGYSAYYQISGEHPDKIAAILAEYNGLDVHLVAGYEDTGLFEVEIHDDNRYFAPLLTEKGALLSEMWTVDGESHLLVHIPAKTSSAEVIDLVLEAHPSVEVVAQRQKSYSVPLLTKELFQNAVQKELTNRQQQVLLAAYTNGYFESPRKMSGEEIAAELGISPPTFTEHLRAAERKLLTILF